MRLAERFQVRRLCSAYAPDLSAHAILTQTNRGETTMAIRYRKFDNVGRHNRYPEEIRTIISDVGGPGDYIDVEQSHLARREAVLEFLNAIGKDRIVSVESDPNTGNMTTFVYYVESKETNMQRMKTKEELLRDLLRLIALDAPRVVLLRYALLTAKAHNLDNVTAELETAEKEHKVAMDKAIENNNDNAIDRLTGRNRQTQEG